MPARWLLYSHDALGLGHVRRMLSIARAVLDARCDLSALLITCSPQIDALPMPPGLDYLKLPSAKKLGPHQYAPRTLRMEPPRFRSLRSALVREAAAAFEPHFVLVDKSPLGLMGELSETLSALEARDDVRLVLGWRDVLDSPTEVWQDWRQQGALEVLDRTYHEIWVYGDSRVFDVREAYHLPQRIADRVRHVGYLAPRVIPSERARVRSALGVDDAPLAVVTAGGGENGEGVVAAYLAAEHARQLPEDLQAYVVTGPFMAEDQRRRLTELGNERTRVVTFMPGLESLIAAADVVVGRAGYNTVCEALGASTPAVLVPRMLHRNEQLIRAKRLAELGLAEIVDEESLTPRAMADAVRRALRRGRVTQHHLRVDGLEQVRQRVAMMVPQEVA